ncbi:unnamed protein product [Clonostachys byssicola]|uniref:Uncharacterized protein n=1 Tax=Clonostachys byssicola TaxID=160290 RepID=A0A9N9U765_9HYPO|nr:unnamed protein product [Clonostachys byssicola]
MDVNVGIQFLCLQERQVRAMHGAQEINFVVFAQVVPNWHQPIQSNVGRSLLELEDEISQDRRVALEAGVELVSGTGVE